MEWISLFPAVIQDLPYVKLDNFTDVGLYNIFNLTGEEIDFVINNI